MNLLTPEIRRLLAQLEVLQRKLFAATRAGNKAGPQNQDL